MGYRKLHDRQGRGWEIRPESRRRWWFIPLRGNDEPKRAVRPPGHTDDPFELSQKELQQLLDGARPSPEAEGPRRSLEDLFGGES